jgi:hypothetical protein
MSHMRRSSAASNQSQSSLDEFFDANEVERGNSFFASAAEASSSEDEQEQQPKDAATNAYASLPGVPARQRELPPVPPRPTPATAPVPATEPDVELRKLQIVDRDTGRVVNIDDAANVFQGYSMLPPAQVEEAPPTTSPSKPKRWGFTGRHSRGGGSSAAAAAAAAAEGAVKVESSSKDLK